jgi:hypothetical protein
MVSVFGSQPPRQHGVSRETRAGVDAVEAAIRSVTVDERLTVVVARHSCANGIVTARCCGSDCESPAEWTRGFSPRVPHRFRT